MFASRPYLKEHVASVHENKSLRVKCSVCEEVLPDRKARMRHETAAHFPDKYVQYIKGNEVIFRFSKGVISEHYFLIFITEMNLYQNQGIFSIMCKGIFLT